MNLFSSRLLAQTKEESQPIGCNAAAETPHFEAPRLLCHRGCADLYVSLQYLFFIVQHVEFQCTAHASWHSGTMLSAAK